MIILMYHSQFLLLREFSEKQMDWFLVLENPVAFPFTLKTSMTWMTDANYLPLDCCFFSWTC